MVDVAGKKYIYQSLKNFKLIQRRIMKKAFTLIELLVVIAIIGILSAMVLVSLSTARNKAKDTRVQAAVSQYRAAAEMYFAANGKYYVSSTDNVCAGADAYGLQNLRKDITLQLTGTAETTFAGCDVTTTGDKWSLITKLPSFTGASVAVSATTAGNNPGVCVDSTGQANTYKSTVGTTSSNVCAASN